MTRFPTLAGEVHAASELNDNYRRILDEAKETGIARVRDRDGVSLLVIPEDAVKQVVVAQDLAQVARDLVVLLRAGSGKTDMPRLLASAWPWLRWFDEEDRAECLGELSDLFLEAAAIGNLARFKKALRAWRVTAEALEDDRARAILLGGQDSPDDYVEVGRAESEEPRAEEEADASG